MDKEEVEIGSRLSVLTLPTSRVMVLPVRVLTKICIIFVLCEFVGVKAQCETCCVTGWLAGSRVTL